MFEDVYSHRQTTTSIGAAGRHFLVVFQELQTIFAKKTHLTNSKITGLGHSSEPKTCLFQFLKQNWSSCLISQFPKQLH